MPGDDEKQTRLRLALAAGAVIAAIAGAAIYLDTSSRAAGVASDYVAALGMCETDPEGAAARIAALERMHGKTSAPRDLRASLSICSLQASVKALK